MTTDRIDRDQSSQFIARIGKQISTCELGIFAMLLEGAKMNSLPLATVPYHYSYL